MNGRIHSIETMGMDDGPGIRYVLFMQGCPLRCRFCHNPDTWITTDGQEMDSETIIKEVTSYLPYYKPSGGGITVSGGEPLMQAEFVLDLFRKCKEAGIHTALDTTGLIWNSTVEELLRYTDLVLLDLKEMDQKKHHELTGVLNKTILQFATYLSDHGIATWIRHVLVPGLTDHTEGLHQLGSFIQEMENIKRLDLLPFHKLGEYKWKELGYDYTLTDVQPPSDEEMDHAYSVLAQYVPQEKMPSWKKLSAQAQK